MLSSEKIDETLQSVNASKKILIAYSGGLDSHVLLHLLASLPNYFVRAMHIHHGLLDEADAWVGHCKRICLNLNVELQTKHLDLSIKQGESVEDVARSARYRALIQSLQNDETLLTAHHQNDQTETFLLQLFRGAGVNGLAAMPESIDLKVGSSLQKGQRFHSNNRVIPFKQQNGKLAKKGGMCALYEGCRHIRPLLNESRESLEDYAKKHHLNYIEDPSNADIAFDRNYLRNEILPQLRSRWLGLDKSISRSASIQAETKKLLDELAKEDLKKLILSDAFSINLKKLSKLSDSRQKLVVRYWISQCGFLSPSAKKLKHIFSDVIEAREDAQPIVAWGGETGAEVRRFDDSLIIMQPLREHDSTQILVWDTQQPLAIPSLKLLLHFDSLELDEAILQNQDKGVTVRFRQGGESIFIAKRGATISLKNLMHESKVPPWKRSRLPLIYIGEKLVAVIGLD